MKSSRWPSVPIRRLGAVVGGGTPTVDPAYWEGDIPFVTPPDLRPVIGGVVQRTQRTLTAEGAAAGSSIVPSDSVLLSIRAPIGYVARTADAVAFNQGCRAVVPFEQTSAPYLTYALVAAGDELDSLSRGTTFMELSANQMAGLELPVPPLAEQRAIADYLDRETARIDTLIEEQQRLIETLLERRRVVLIEATCRGISASATLQQSGVDWMGEIPSHWQLIAIKWLTPVRRGASPRPIQDPVYFDDDGEWAWVRIADVSSAGSGGVLLETTQTLSALGSSLSVKIKPGELFVSIAGTVGKPCIAGIQCCIHDGFVYFPELDINPWWLFRVFEAGECYGGLGKMGTQLNLNTDTIGGIQVPIPPPDEMAMVLAYIEAQTTKIDELIAESERFIELSRERRAALIAAAVTGQIDVREVA